MKYVVTLNGKNYEVDVDELNEATVVSVTDAVPQVQKEAVSQAPAVQVPAAAGSGTAVKAPMPGTILSVNYSAGQKVSEGDVLMILEAMKMENEIVAPKSGTLTSVTVSKGSSVATDDVLAYVD